MCNSFKVDLETNEDRNRRESADSNNILMRDYKPTSNNNNRVQSNNNNNDNYKINVNNNINKQQQQQQQDNKWERFGGKAPFQYLHEKDDDMNGAENERYNKIKHNIPSENVVYKKPISSSLDKKEKDPMVWDPPEDKKVINKKNVVPSKNNNNNINKNVKKVESKQSSNNNVEDKKDKRNYEKPWKLPEEKKISNKDQKENKSSFLLHCYPDGTGPDSDLIEMIEREVVDTNPNVKFEDIADLDKAKNVLKEAVLLPLLMPEYFKVKIYF
jgi:katanin p60 ATPase-containing subunit A1